MKLVIAALLGYSVLGRIGNIIRTHTPEEYWAGWTKFLSLESVKARKQMYSTKAEHDKRFEIFKDNMEKMKAHNQGEHSWTMGINQFSDMTPNEFKQYIGSRHFERKPSNTKFEAPMDWVSDSIDWVSHGAVTPVKDQGDCGSDWAFSTTGAIESATFLSIGKLISLSEQDLISCNTANNACDGGSMDLAFDFVTTNGGLCSEDDYKYKGKDKNKCKDDKCDKYSPISSYQDVAQSTAALEAALESGPVSVAIEADQNSFQSYSGGILTSSCGTALSYGALAVGYGNSGGQDYWKVKMSWGTKWGEDGYIRLCRNCDANNGAGQCGILTLASYPIV